MSKRRPPDGPSFTKATYDRRRPRFEPPSPSRQKAVLDERARDAAKLREISADPAAWARKHILGIQRESAAKSPQSR